MTGTVVAVEGIDGSGKTTQVRRLTAWLDAMDRPHRVLSLYGNSLVSRQFAGLNQQTTITAREATLLTAGDVAGRTEALVEPLVASGNVVIWDKYVIGSRARDRARGVADEVLDAVYDPLPPADTVLFLTVDPEVAAVRRRAEGGPELWEAGLDVFLGLAIPEIERRLASGALHPDELDGYFVAFQTRVAEEYSRLIDDAECLTVDAAAPVDALTEAVREVLAPRLGVSMMDAPS